MTIGTLTLLTATGSLLLLKLALMALAVVLLTKTLLHGRKRFTPGPALAGLPLKTEVWR